MKRQIDKNGRVTLPSEYRRALNINDCVEVELKGKSIVLTNPIQDEVKQVILSKLDELPSNEKISDIIEYIQQNL